MAEEFIKVDDRGIKELQAKLERWARVAPEEVKNALRNGAEMVRAEAQFNHLNGPKMPRGITGGFANSTLGKVSGNLYSRMSIRVMANQQGKFSAEVGTNVRGKFGEPYPRYHEYGLHGMPERPFLRPSLEKKRPEVFDSIAKAFMASYGK